MTIAPETSSHENTTVALGGLVDGIGGIATAAIAICGLANLNPTVMVAAATIVFGVALLLQGSACVAAFSQIATARGRAFEINPGGDAMAVILIGAAGIVLGILSLLRIDAAAMIPAAVIAFGVAMILGNSLVPHLHEMRHAAQARVLGGRGFAGRETVFSQMATGSAVAQALAGLAAIVLGILVLAGLNNQTLILVALLELGATLVVTGGAMTTTILGAMESRSE